MKLWSKKREFKIRGFQNSFFPCSTLRVPSQFLMTLPHKNMQIGASQELYYVLPDLPLPLAAKDGKLLPQKDWRQILLYVYQLLIYCGLKLYRGQYRWLQLPIVKVWSSLSKKISIFRSTLATSYAPKKMKFCMIQRHNFPRSF